MHLNSNPRSAHKQQQEKSCLQVVFFTNKSFNTYNLCGYARRASCQSNKHRVPVSCMDTLVFVTFLPCDDVNQLFEHVKLQPEALFLLHDDTLWSSEPGAAHSRKHVGLRCFATEILALLGRPFSAYYHLADPADIHYASAPGKRGHIKYVRQHGGWKLLCCHEVWQLQQCYNKHCKKNWMCWKKVKATYTWFAELLMHAPNFRIFLDILLVKLWQDCRF